MTLLEFLKQEFGIDIGGLTPPPKDEHGIDVRKIFAIMKTILFLGSLGWGEILIIALIVLLLFGGRKIPELMKGIGKGVKSFKDGVKVI